MNMARKLRKIIKGDYLMKISNLDLKVAKIFCVIVSSLIIIPCIVMLFIFDKWIIGIAALIIGLLTGLTIVSITIYSTNWPETIEIDEEKIIVYRWGKEINRINWQDVKEIHKKDVIARYRLYCYYFFSDGQDRFLNAKDGNEHFVVFRCPRKKEYLFSQFTDLPIQNLEPDK